MNFRTQSFLLSTILCLAVCSCAPSAEEKRKMVTSNYEITEADSIISSSAAIENKADTIHKFIRTAELKFKVKKVTEATYFIEDITSKMNGFVTYTNLSSHVINNATTRVSDDSLVNLTNFQVHNDMTIRVSNSKLDTTLKLIAQTISFLDYRIIKADDVNIQLLSNNLTQKRASKNENRIENAIDKQGKKLTETTQAEELLDKRQQQADEAKMANLSLMDQMNYSTINLNIYQNEETYCETVASKTNIESFEPNIFIKIGQSIKTGWSILETIFINLLKLWPLLIVAGFVIWYLKKRD
ncbi:MAG: DUF4349 domain-containing protein [Candidatus Methylacidiphilales bacterium]